MTSCIENRAFFCSDLIVASIILFFLNIQVQNADMYSVQRCTVGYSECTLLFVQSECTLLSKASNNFLGRQKRYSEKFLTSRTYPGVVLDQHQCRQFQLHPVHNPVCTNVWHELCSQFQLHPVHTPRIPLSWSFKFSKMVSAN